MRNEILRYAQPAKLHQITSKESVELLCNKYQEKQELEQLQDSPKIKEGMFTALTCPNQMIKNEKCDE